MTDFKTLLENVKSDTAKQEIIRTTIAKICYNALLAELGEDNVRYLENEIGVGENGKKISKGTVIVGIPDLTDKDGYNVTGVASFAPTAHRWNTTTTAKKTTPAITMEDIDIAIDTARELAKVKTEKAEKEKQAKIKKMQKDFERREKNKGQ
jgi:predicted HTH transcriptional regulator